MSALWNRIYSSPAFLPVLSVVAVLSLTLSTFTVVRIMQAQAQRETDRVVSDVASCERGNLLRSQVSAIGAATDQLVDGIVDFALRPRDDEETNARIEIARQELEPLFATYRASVADIAQVDCRELTPGAGGN